MAYRQPRTQAVRKPSLQVAGLQVHATTLSCWLLWRKQNLNKSPRDLRITTITHSIQERSTCFPKTAKTTIAKMI